MANITFGSFCLLPVGLFLDFNEFSFQFSLFLLNHAKFKGGVLAIFNCLLFVFYLSIYLFIWD